MFEKTKGKPLTPTNSAGGFYSNTEDLIKFGESILNHDLLSGAETRKWLKPTEHTSSLGQSIGAPWEIIRTKNLTTDGRVIDLYTKSGDLGPYHALFALIPDYDLVFTLLTGGPEASNSDVFFGTAKALEILLPALDKAAKTEAAQNLVGEYVDEATNSTITLTVDDGPGLLVSNWFSRGFDVLNGYPAAIQAMGSGESNAPVPEASVRLYHTGLAADNETGWRAVFHMEDAETLAAVDESIPFIPQVTCQTWFVFERTNYGLNSVDDFVLKCNGEGSAEEVTSRFFRTSMALTSRE